jgi:hypothetical protein
MTVEDEAAVQAAIADDLEVFRAAPRRPASGDRRLIHRGVKRVTVTP